jgi:hypothetical protein
VRGVRCVSLSIEENESISGDGIGGDDDCFEFIYGVNGVEERMLNNNEEELGLLISVKSRNKIEAMSHLALLRATLLHYGFEGRKATAGNLAFPFSPSDMRVISNTNHNNEDVDEEENEEWHEYVTVCGTRDPNFIKQHQAILNDVEKYVYQMTNSGDTSSLIVSCLPYGLTGQSKLRVEEIVCNTVEEGTARLMKKEKERKESSSSNTTNKTIICKAGQAADFLVHHLLNINDNDTLNDLFTVTLHHNDADDEIIQTHLREWGLEAGPIKTVQDATQNWTQSNKPKGTAAAGSSKYTLGDLAQVIRSKNAGVNEITFDCIFNDRTDYDFVKNSSSLDMNNMADVLHYPIIGIYCDDSSLAIKITCDRQINSGSKGDRDVYGAQQHRILIDLQL